MPAIYPALGGLLLAWAIFHLLGSLLLRIPPEMHDGNIWFKKALEEQP